jgi:hypothetical protein
MAPVSSRLAAVPGVFMADLKGEAGVIGPAPAWTEALWSQM